PVRDIEVLQAPELLRRLDTFGNDGAIQAPGQLRNGAHDEIALLGTAQLADKQPVDLDAVEWESDQVAQRRVSCSEIVHRDGESHLLEMPQRTKRLRIVLQQARLGNFKLESGGRQ